MFHLFGFGFLVCLALYFLPTILGWHKRNVGGIFVLNLLLGWTLIGWVIALIWAISSEPAIVYVPTVARPQAWGCACGAAVQPGQRFCSSCGARITWTPV